MVEQGTENPRVVGSIPTGGTTADLAHLVERDLAKVEVAGSSPVIRSRIADANRIHSHPLFSDLFPSLFRFLPPPLSSFISWRHSQAVRQRSAKPSSPVRFRVAPPSPVLKDAGRKTRDFLGFSSFFSVFLAFSKFDLKQKQKDAKYRFRPSFRNRTGERPFQGVFQRVFLSENRPFFVFFKKIIVK